MKGQGRVVVTGGEEPERGSTVGDSGERLAVEAGGMKGCVEGNLRDRELSSDFDIQKVFTLR